MTWFRSQARPQQPRIVAVTSVYTWSPLVEHFIGWYSRPELDADKIVLCVTPATRKRVEAVINDRCLLHDVSDIPHDSRQFDAHKDKGERQAWEQLGFSRDDYRLAVDLDEFQSYPWPLREIVAEMAARHEWALAGILVDRFAADYSTPAIRPPAQSPLEQQFPIVRQWPVRDWPEIRDQTTPWGACVVKVVVCKGAVELGPGRHHAKNALIARHAPFGFNVTDLKVHHYRWASGVTEMLEARANDPRFEDRYRKECLDARKWLADQQQASAGGRK